MTSEQLSNGVTPPFHADLAQFLSPEEILDKSSPLYASESAVWNAQCQMNPTLVIRPKSVASLQKAVEYLCKSRLDFAVRSGGVGSSSARDVLLSMTAFDSVSFDPDSETITVGAGNTWEDVSRKLEEIAPGYAATPEAVCARTPYVGVGGSILGGGLSWLSHEFGMGSDPHNFFDAHVVLTNGQAVWASTKPDLLWALRGGGGNFGVVTSFKIRVYPYPAKVYSGMIMIPDSSLETLSKRVSAFVDHPDPKMALHIMMMGQEQMFDWDGQYSSRIVLQVYDGHGEAHGRSDAGFKWALDIPGARDTTSEMTLRQVGLLQADSKAGMGLLNSWMSGATVSKIDPEFVTRCYNWYSNISKISPALPAGSFCLLEIMQPNSFSSAGSIEEQNTAWPHNFHRHVLQLGTGFAPGADCSEELALRVLAEAPSVIALDHGPGQFIPNFYQPFNNLKELFGINYERLREIKKQYDPAGRLNKGVFIPPA